MRLSSDFEVRVILRGVEPASLQVSPRIPRLEKRGFGFLPPSGMRQPERRAGLRYRASTSCALLDTRACGRLRLCPISTPAGAMGDWRKLVDAAPCQGVERN